MKKGLIFVSVVGLLIGGLSQWVYAQSACGGTIEYNKDCDNTRRSWGFSCCPEGYRVQGVAYTDIRKQDHVDAISAVCRSVTRGNDVMPSSDFQRNPLKLVCEKSEVMAGIYAKDVLTNSGDRRDTLDGLTAVCQHPGDNSLRRIFNADIQGGREGVEFSVRLPRRVVGIAYRERDNKGGDAGSSDRADCVTIITK